MKAITKNTLFYDDNLIILRENIPDESVDLIYLDPPLNSNSNYNLLFKLEDIWHWNLAAEVCKKQYFSNYF